MQIKQKLFLNTSVVVVSMLVLVVAFFLAEEKLKDLIDGKERAQQQEVEMLLLRRHEKDFLARQDMKYVQRFNQVAERIISQQQQLDELFDKNGMNTQSFAGLGALFADYRQDFSQLVSAKQAMGLTQNEGLEGQLRSAVHDIESSLERLDKDALLVLMLQLRRHEKDFMLRLDMKYPQRFNTTLAELKQGIDSASDISATERTNLLALADRYQQRFAAFVMQQQRIGLDSEQGILGEMRTTIHKTETRLTAMAQAMETQTNTLLKRMEWILTTLFIAVVVLSVVIAWRIAASINRPLALIHKAMVKIDQTHDLSMRVAYDGKDEIGDVSRSINQMLTGFQAVVRSVNDTVINMNQQTDNLSQTAARTANDAERQRDETDMVATSVTEMVGTIEDISQNMEAAVGKTQTAQSSASEGQAKVSSAIERVNGLSQRLQSSMSTADQLAKESQSIGSVLSVIQEIAEQTNLLALNAAIEAARAGEQGRGFAVVADEVRALASRTHDATVEVSDIIESLQNRSKSIVQIMQECSEEGLTSRDEASMIGDVLTNITREVDEIADMAHSVASAIGQQSIAANEISRNVEVIREITTDTSEAVRLNSQASDDISVQAHQLEDVVSKFRL
ncbi:methyl-accepting chemotaxis protein [Marinomonas ostreistagni]|uniref:methyl-accepting chemotaxis protein n=1 Tax=Marinomonas ostreistagni TaxID=359209 RepID=UPI001950792A|nr:methyl-accepting chemotaxis protein [Marinomonas ostreistagni]